MNEILCPICGSPNKPESKFCRRCGASLTGASANQGNQASGYRASGQIICPRCGTAESSARQTCSCCGQPLYSSAANQGSARPAYDDQATITPRSWARAVPQKEKEAGIGFYILIGALAALLVAGALLLALNWKNWFGGKNKPGPETQAATQSTTATEAPTQEDEPTQAQANASEGDSAAESTAETPTEDGRTKISIDDARQKIERRYDCIAEMDREDDGKYYFQCYYKMGTGGHWGEVSVDAYTGALETVSGMQASAVRSLSTDRVDGIVNQVDRNALYSFAILDLNTGEFLGSANADQQMSSSVLIDIPILYTVSGLAERGELSLQDKVQIHYTTYGRGVLSQADNGSYRTVKELLSIMFKHSDNNATNSFMDHLTLRKINSFCQNEGYYSVSAANRIGETTDYTSSDNYVSARDLCWMLYELYNSSGELNRDFLLENLSVSDGTEAEGLNKYFNADRFLCFNGMKATKYNEILIVEKGSQAYAIALLSNNANLQDLQKIAAAIGSYISDSIG